MASLERAQVGHIFRLAVADLLHDRLVSLCQIILLVALFAPLLLLLALKYGVVTTLLDDLSSNPETLRLRPIGSYHLGTDFFTTLGKRPDVGFVMPATRSIAAQIYLRRDRPEDAHPALFDVQMVPTGRGDPLGQGQDLADATGGVSLSEAVARQMQVRPGDRIIGSIERLRDGRPEVASIPLHVRGIVPERLHGQSSVFVDLALLVAAERFRDNYAVPLFGSQVGRPWTDMTEYASFRAYARGLRDVSGLAAHLRAMGIEVKTEADQIESVLDLEHNLDVLFAAIAAISAIGLVGALTASMVAGVDRKRRSMAVLGLLGFSRRSIMIFPLVQAWVIGFAGVAVGLALAGFGAMAINAYFAPVFRDGQVAARLEAGHIGVATAVIALLTSFPAAIAARRVSRIDPAEGLREV
jgi:putative ABC transport system permease protein